jgi:hypothetical protein
VVKASLLQKNFFSGIQRRLKVRHLTKITAKLVTTVKRCSPPKWTTYTSLGHPDF